MRSLYRVTVRAHPLRVPLPSRIRPTRSLHTMLVRSLIGNDAPTTRQTFDVVHPGTGITAHQVQRSTEADIARAVEVAHSAFPEWKKTTLASRIDIINRAADLIDDKSSGWADRLIKANMAETSVTEFWTTHQIEKVTPGLRALASAAEEALGETTVSSEDHSWTLQREPYGTCLAIAAWNAVHLLTMRSIVTPLLAGNTVVLKTTEQTPLSQSLWAELLHEAGVPKEALTVVHVSTGDAADLVNRLVADKRVRHVNFTGSTRVGSIIAGTAGANLKPTLMELGGKAPVLILPDADIETAAYHIIFGAFMNAGMICMSTERVIVPASKYDAVVEALKEAWATVEKKQSRALFTSATAERVRGLIGDATGLGAKDVFGGELTPGEQGAHIHPLILGPVDSSMRISKEETFGPVCAIIKVDDGDEAKLIDEMVRVANDSEYGLAASVWGKDVERAEAVAKRIEAGAVHVNAPTVADPPVVPHGGWKSSGWGRFNGVEGLRSFTQMRSIEVVKAAPKLPLNVFEL